MVCKSLIDIEISGRLGSNTRQSGEILINGRNQALAFGTSAFSAQDDALLTTLTEMGLKKERAEMTIKEMGLSSAMDTRIGGWASKGLSGGRKRRVSICIQILTRPQLLFLDEPTSGLDSAASYHVMKKIVGLAKQGNRTIITSIHQPSSEVFELFDTLGLLSAGTTVYFGPAASANKFFAMNGFPGPSMRNPSDHFLRTINKDFDQELGALEKKGSQASFLTQCIALTRRSFVNMNRDLGYYWLRLAIYIAMCLRIGNVYNNARGMMLMFVSSIMTFLAIGGFPSFVEEMKVFDRERLNGHYGVSAFVISNTLSSTPFLVLVSVVPCSIAYFLVGLHGGASHFLHFVLLLFVCMMLVESLMMMVASFVPDFFMGIMTGAGIQGLMILNNGFFRLPSDLPNLFWKYPMYYIAFHNYATQGLYKNEFLGLTFPNSQADDGLPKITGKEVLERIWEVEMGPSKWVDLGILIGMVCAYRFMFLVVLKVIEMVKPVMRAIFPLCPQKLMQATEQPSAPAH
ncbi:hypothetical protein ACLOJK_016328 [Asimina triloba]